MACSREGQAIRAEALSIALQQPAITGDLRTVCQLLLTCKAWRAALQQCSAGHLSIGVIGCSVIRKATQTSRLAVWLPKHSGLVGQLTLHTALSHHSTAHLEEYAVAEQTLAISLQLAATRTASAAAGAAPLLRLRSASIGFLQSPVLLQSLPVAALTQLHLRYCSKNWPTHLSLNSSSITQGLMRLTNLQVLHLTASKQLGSWVGNPCLAAVGHLTQLTELQLCCVAAGSHLWLLPRQLRHLQLSVCCSDSEGSNSSNDSSSSTAVALGHLSALLQLEVCLSGCPADDSSLPPGLTGLSLLGHSSRGRSSTNNMQHLSLAPLLQLQQLVLRDAAIGVEQLQALSKVSALTSIALGYNDVTLASSQAPAWRHLPALQSLSLFSKCMVGADEPDVEAVQLLDQAASLALLECLAAATSLTQLKLMGNGDQPEQAWCGHLGSLLQLQSLELHDQQPFDRADLLQLTVLANLTSLEVVELDELDDVAAVALALQMTKLQQLSLEMVSLSCAAALPAIAALTALTKLSLSTAVEMQGLGHADLKLLMPLTRLKQFHDGSLFEEDAVEDLWDYRSCTWRQQQQQ